jgi:hypothetical protein
VPFFLSRQLIEPGYEAIVFNERIAGGGRLDESIGENVET